MMNFKNVLKNKKTAVLLLNMVLMSSAQAMWEEEFENQQRTSIIEHKKKKNSYRLSVKNTVEEHLKKYPDLLDSSKGKDIVVFLGNTGAGKSTLINYLSEKELKADRFKSIILNNPNDISAMEIGAGASSKTLLPQSIEVEGTLFYDLPGFGDTRGTSVNLVNACFIKNIIEEAKSVKLIFVAGVDQITADRGKPFNIFLEKIRHLIPNKEIEDFSSLVISRS